MSRAANALDKKVTHPSRLLPHFQHSSLVLSTVTGPGMTNAAPLVTNCVDRLCANLDKHMSKAECSAFPCFLERGFSVSCDLGIQVKLPSWEELQAWILAEEASTLAKKNKTKRSRAQTRAINLSQVLMGPYSN
jgi:hypothetical protein